MSMDALTALGRASFSAAVMILAILVLRLRFQDRTPRRAFCLLWDLALLRLLVPVEIPSPLSIRRWLPDLAVRPAAAQAVQPQVVHASEGTAAVREIYLTSLAEDTACTLLPGGAGLHRLDWYTVLFCLWLGAALLLAAGFLWSHLRSRRLYAASLPCRDGFVLDWLAAHPLRRPVQVRTSDRIAAPLTYGALYPVILLPRAMDLRDRDALSCVLAHEHTHIRRFDPLRKALFAAALCLHWFNPLVWAMYVLAGRDMELSCDEAVLRSGADRERYALALLDLEEQRGRWSPSGSHFSGHALEERIKAIMKRKHISITALIAVLVVMCVTTTVFASAAPEDSLKNAPETGYVYDHLGMVEDDGAAILSKGGENRETLYSVDNGKSWMSEERFHAEYDSWGDDWQVEWWTYEEYKVWLEEEKEALRSLIGERAYTSADGWFIWDQKKVDETIALYESILEDIKNGALHSKTIIDKNGNEVEDVALGSDGPMNMVVASTFEEKDMVSAAPKTVDKTALLEELKAFGIGGDANLMTYNGQLIRNFVDGASVGDGCYSVQYVYTNPDGTVDVHTLRSVIFNPDGSYDTMGDLIGMAVKGDKGFDPALIEAATFSGPQAAYAGDDGPVQDQNGAEPVTGAQAVSAEGTGGSGGRTFEEIFARYEAYGLVYQPRESGMGALAWNGQPVRVFADLKPDGGSFSYEDPYEEDGLTVYTAYDQDGNLTGLTAGPAPVKDAG